MDKLANFAGIAPVNFSSAGKGNDKPSNRKHKVAGNHILLCNSDDSAIIQGLGEESGFLCVLSEAVSKGKK